MLAPAQNRIGVHLGAIDLPVSCVTDHDGVTTGHQIRFGLDQALGYLIGDFLCVLLIDAVMQAPTSDKAMILEIEAIERHFEETSLWDMAGSRR